MKRWISCLGVVLVCVVLSPQARAQLVEPLAGPAYELVNGEPQTNIIIPLKVLDGATVEGATTLAVTAGDAKRSDLVGAFPATFDGKAMQLTLTPNFAQVRWPLTYSVSVRLSGKAAPPKAAPGEPAAAATSAGASSQVIDVPLLLRPAKLEAIPPIAITREDWLPFSRADRSPIDLSLHETSNITSIRALSVKQVDTTTGDGPRLKPAKPQLKLASGGTETLSLTPSGFGVGSTKGSLVLSAEQLSELVTLPYEVKVRVYDWIIIPWFLVFGLLGWLIRHLLQNAGTLAELRLELERKSKEVEEEAATNPSAQDVASVRHLEAASRTQLAASDAVKLREALQSLRTELQRVQTARVEVTRTLWEQVNSTDRVLKTSFDLPNGLELGQVRADLAAAVQALQMFNPKQAQQQLDALKGSLKVLAERVQGWGDSLGASLDTLKLAAKKEGFVLPSSLQPEVGALLDTLTSKLAKTAYDEANPPAAADWLGATHDANVTLHQLAKRLRQGLRLELENVVSVLNSANDASATGFAQILEALPSLEGDVRGVQLDALVNALRETYKKLDVMLKLAEPRALLEQGQLSEAVAKELAQTGAVSSGAKISARLAAPSQLADVVAAVAAATRPAPPQPRTLLIMPSRTREERALTQLQTLNYARGIVSGALMAVVTWVLYRDSWVGTPGDFTGVAAFAFFTDFTLQGVLEAAGKVKKVSLG